MVQRAEQEAEDGTKVALASKVKDLNDYDVVYLGTPVWYGSLPRAVVTFLEENDMSGKTVVPFGIHLGSGFSSIMSEIRELCPDAKVVQGFTVSVDTANDTVKQRFDTWLDELKLK